MMPESGWLTSCAMDAVNAPSVATLATCARSRARPLECLLGKSPRRHVLYRSDVLHPPVLIPAAVRDCAQVLHRVIRQAQPNLVVDVAARPSGELHFLYHEQGVLRVDSIRNLLEAHATVRVKLEDAIRLL